MTRWDNPAFLDESESWIRDTVDVTGDMGQIHDQRWSTIIRVPTPDGTVFFKASAEAHVFEPDLIQLLSSMSPFGVPEVIAVHPSRKWMITRDGGTRLRELMVSSADWVRWLAVLPQYAELQIAAAARVDEMIGLHVPVEPLATIPDRVAANLARTELLLLNEPAGLTTDEMTRFEHSLGEIEQLCADLAAIGIPETVQHDDLNDGNVFFDGRHHRVMDWGDSCVSHPFHSLTVLLRATAYRLDLEPGGPELTRMVESYLEPFQALADADDLVTGAQIAYRTGTLARALAWARYLGQRDPADWGEDVESVPYGYKKFLENGPIGTWRD